MRDDTGQWMSCQPGHVVAGEYVIKRLLGFGGVGEVYLVEHRTLKADFALKVLLPRWRTREDIKARFRQESRALWELSHPSFVQVHHAGDCPVTGPYIAMEVLQGKTLAALGKAHAPSFDDALALGLEIAEAADVMHSHGILHRDLKPENIFITVGKRGRDGAEAAPRRVKLLDLGAAKIARYDTPRTEDDQTVGTGRYMSPEHVRCMPLTPASDVYALAHILFEFITRTHPFPGAPPSPTHFDFQRMHVEVAPRPLVSVMPGAPALLSEVLAQAMAKAPAERFQTMGAFARALGEARRLLKVEQAKGRTERLSTPEALVTLEDALAEVIVTDPLGPTASTQATGVASLVELREDGSTRTHSLGRGETIIGRGEHATLRLHHATLSGRHARLCVHPTGIVELFDEGSAAGTSVNGKTLTYSLLRHMDRVRFGAVTCELRMLDPSKLVLGTSDTVRTDGPASVTATGPTSLGTTVAMDPPSGLGSTVSMDTAASGRASAPFSSPTSRVVPRTLALEAGSNPFAEPTARREPSRGRGRALALVLGVVLAVLVAGGFVAWRLFLRA